MASQLNERHADLKVAIDELRDSVLEAGPNPAGHRDTMRAISAAHPGFFLDFTLALANYTNDQADELDAGTIAAVKELYTNSTDVVVTAHDLGAARLAAAIENLGIAERLQPKDVPPAK